ncbi:MAG: hypothetical protein II882_09910 [Lachnospiraceae bacterium]|nr:hypothetical protein [Lachnospiraceae bacterium]
MKKAGKGIGLILLLLLLAISGCGKKSATVNINDYLSVSTDGFDNYGVLSSSFDQKGLQDALIAQLGYKRETRLGAEMISLLEHALQSVITGEWNKTKDLKNGDVLTYTWTVDDALLADTFNVTLLHEPFEYTVGNLTVGKEVDPFQNLTWSVEGFNGEAVLTYQGDPGIGGLSYVYEGKTEELCNGDVLHFSLAGYSDEKTFLHQTGSVITVFEKDFTVDGLIELVAFDPFDYLTVSFEGVGPFAELKLDVQEMPVEGLVFEADRYNHFSNDQEFTIRVLSESGETDLDAYCRQFHYQITRTSQDYISDGLDEYLRDANMLDTETIRKIDEEVSAYFKDLSQRGRRYYPKANYLESFKVHDIYLLYSRNSEEDELLNILMVVFEVSLTTGDTYYYASYYENLFRHADGTIDLDPKAHQEAVSYCEKIPTEYINNEGFRAFGFDTAAQAFNELVLFRQFNYSYTTYNMEQYP